jgi:hypothetical protein
MAKRRAEYRNEVKSRLRDPTYLALQKYKQLHGIDSDSAALARIADQALLGMVGSIPDFVASISDDLAHDRTMRAAA